MVYLYSGTPGSGKSLDTCRVILNNIRNKSPVICNFNINIPNRLQKNKDYFIFKNNSEITVKYLVDFASEYWKSHKFKEGKILLVIDECQLMFNAREWNAKGRDVWLKFFTNHRHLGYDIVLVAQFDLMIDKQIRSLIEYEVIHRKVSNFGLKGFLLQLFMLAPVLFVRVKMWYPMKVKTDSSFYRYSKYLGNCYNSYSTDFINFDFNYEEN